MGRQFCDMVRHRCAFRAQEIVHRPGQSFVQDDMGAVGFHGQVAAQQFMLALGAGLNPLQPARNRKIDRLIVAGLDCSRWASCSTTNG